MRVRRTDRARPGGRRLFGLGNRCVPLPHRRLPTPLSGYARRSAFFDRTFVGAVSIGLVFLLAPSDQQQLLGNVSSVLEPGGRFLFSAPREMCEWKDTLTGRTSTSLGSDAYAGHLAAAGLDLRRCHSDEGGNTYYEAVKTI
jgi:hypothetical protein